MNQNLYLKPKKHKRVCLDTVDYWTNKIMTYCNLVVFLDFHKLALTFYNLLSSQINALNYVWIKLFRSRVLSCCISQLL